MDKQRWQIDYWTPNFPVLHQKSHVTWFIGLNFGTIQHFMSPLGTPFEVAYGRQPPNLIRFLSNETKVTAVALEFIKRDEALNQFKVHSTRARAQMKKYADRKRRVVNFKVGEWVS